MLVAQPYFLNKNTGACAGAVVICPLHTLKASMKGHPSRKPSIATPGSLFGRKETRSGLLELPFVFKHTGTPKSQKAETILGMTKILSTIHVERLVPQHIPGAIRIIIVHVDGLCAHNLHLAVLRVFWVANIHGDADVRVGLAGTAVTTTEAFLG